MTGFQRCGIMGTWGDLEGDLGDKMAQSPGTTGIEGFSGLYRGPGRRYGRGEGHPGGGGSALNKRSPTVITILKHTRKITLL